MNKKTIQEILNGISIETEEALLEISDEISIKESIGEIKNKATLEAFTIFIGVQTIGCWKSGGWATGIFGNYPEIVPYIPSAMKSLQLENVAQLVEKAIHLFPEKTDFTENDQDYCDVINFLEGHDRFIKNKQKFEQYSSEEKSQIRENYHNAIEKLEKEVDPIWGYDAPNQEGWGNIIHFLKSNLNAKIWKE
ncbi:hypothetical protein [Flavobacterium sp. N2038]|uniref:hypothetical protein n=1 Tax=Flavobacterium sp. N2038 TaxID=2986829 RepID=UPI0022247F4B|nr:hypothetical protein [Flavobacterium sp. N2038]